MENSKKNPPSPVLVRRSFLAVVLAVLCTAFCVLTTPSSGTGIWSSPQPSPSSAASDLAVSVGLFTKASGFFDLQGAETDDLSCAKTISGQKLIPGGIPFGVKLRTDGVLVVDTAPIEGTEKSPAAEAGILSGDLITAIDGKPVTSVSDVTKAIEESGGKSLTFTVKRDGSSLECKIMPVKADGTDKYKAGLWLKDSIAGIGTVTYVDPSTLEFGGLGHGICDAETGVLFPAMQGTVKSVAISGATKGLAGMPGALKGSFGADNIGTITANTASGVFGKFDSLPADFGKPMEIAATNQVHEGDAYIISTVNSDGPKKYNVKISELNSAAANNKNFVITVTDGALIEATGGIVQGMSGSPVIQDGKLIGAVTHVLISNPAKGYGIFIENMLNAKA